MTPKQTIKLLETEFKQKVDIVTSPTFSSKSVEDKIAELAKMYRAGQNIQRLLNDGKGLTADEVKQYRGRVLTGFKKLNAIIRSISSELAAEEDAISIVKTKASVKENNMRTMDKANAKTAKELIENFGRMVDAAQYPGFYLVDPKPTNLRNVVNTIENINAFGDRTYKLKGTFQYEDIKDLSLLSWVLRYRDKRLEADIISDLNREYGTGAPKFMPSEYLHKCWRYFPTMAYNCEQAAAYKQEQDKKWRSDPSSITYRG